MTNGVNLNSPEFNINSPYQYVIDRTLGLSQIQVTFITCYEKHLNHHANIYKIFNSMHEVINILLPLCHQQKGEVALAILKDMQVFAT